jgi:DNA-binding ferritin-like protein (Dps family)
MKDVHQCKITTTKWKVYQSKAPVLRHNYQEESEAILSYVYNLFSDNNSELLMSS